MVLLAGIPVLLLGSAGTAAFLIPGLAKYIPIFRSNPSASAQTAAGHPVFVDLPEMAVTLPNDGHPRQMRIHISLELNPGAPAPPPTDVLSPRVYDALLTYLRTLGDGELDGAMAIDRIRADLYRRLQLILGPGVVRDVLITGLVVA
jgi:flagellar protein FliL